jgi:hypothetical protein
VKIQQRFRVPNESEGRVRQRFAGERDREISPASMAGEYFLTGGDRRSGVVEVLGLRWS